MVGRFFRDNIDWAKYEDEHVLIPMWWGGFSEFMALDGDYADKS